MIVYILNMTACALLLYAFYVLLLEEERMHRFKRIYLLGSLVFSICVPFATTSVEMPQIPLHIAISENVRTPVNFDQTVSYTNSENFETSEHSVIPVNSDLFEHSAMPEHDEYISICQSFTQIEETTFSPFTINFPLLLLVVYIAVAAFFLFRLALYSRKMLVCGHQNACMDYHNAKLALIDEKIPPHSFWHYIFINRHDHNNGTVADEIIAHELAHVRQWHSLDILFVELLIAIAWFNPVLYLFRTKIRQNHEFLADHVVIENNAECIPVYQTVMINCITQVGQTGIASDFSFSFLKRRFLMMSKNTSRLGAACRSVALIPVFLVAFFYFSANANASFVDGGFFEQEEVEIDAEFIEIDTDIEQTEDIDIEQAEDTIIIRHTDFVAEVEQEEDIPEVEQTEEVMEVVFVAQAPVFLVFGQAEINTVAQASATLPDKARVILRGNIISQFTHDRYIFRDATGEIAIKIKQDRWRGLSVVTEDVVEIFGDFKRDKKNWQLVHIDVKQIVGSR